MATNQDLGFAERALPRAVVSLVIAAAVAVGYSLLSAQPVPIMAVVMGWVVFALVDATWTWGVLSRMDTEQTRAHAVAEDPARGVADVVLLIASGGSLAGVALLLIGSSGSGSQSTIPWEGLLGIAAVAASWFLVHTMFVVRYADLYYSELAESGVTDLNSADAQEVGGVSFNQKSFPTYRDFAYLSFTLGMTYQVSDTNISSTPIRREVLRHCLISYVLGAVILAVSVNLVVSLAQSTGQG